MVVPHRFILFIVAYGSLHEKKHQRYQAKSLECVLITERYKSLEKTFGELLSCQIETSKDFIRIVHDYPNMQALELKDSNIALDDSNTVVLRRLKALIFNYCNISTALKCPLKESMIQFLSFINVYTNINKTILCNMPNLHILSLENTSIENNAFSLNMKHLKWLRLQNANVKYLGSSIISTMPNLERLWFYSEHSCFDCRNDWLMYHAKLGKFKTVSTNLYVYGTCFNSHQLTRVHWHELQPCGYCWLRKSKGNCRILIDSKIDYMKECYARLRNKGRNELTYFSPNKVFILNRTPPTKLILKELKWTDESVRTQCFQSDCVNCFNRQLKYAMQIANTAFWSDKGTTENLSFKVCGTNNVTYESLDIFLSEKNKSEALHGIDIAHIGECRKDCKGVLCLHPAQLCYRNIENIQPVCTRQLITCDKYEPVCDIEGNSYINKCHLINSRTQDGFSKTFAYPGWCRENVNCSTEDLCPNDYECFEDSSGTPVCTSCDVLNHTCSGAAAICGDNGVVYRDYCQLEQDRCLKRSFIKIVRLGNCAE